jgi:hypothetical protein
VIGGRRDGRTVDGGRGRRRRSGYSTKNKNPTCQCGEIQKRERKKQKNGTPKCMPKYLGYVLTASC